jgi:hypothetical protein
MASRRRWTVIALVTAGWVYSFAHFIQTGVVQPQRVFYGDFLASFPTFTIARFLGRHDLYDGSLSQFWGPPPIWHYGPVEHIITLPLYWSPTLPSAYRTWLFVNYFFVAAIVALMVGVIDEWRPSFRTLSLVVFVTFNFNAFYEALTQRAIEIFELLLLLAALAFVRKGRAMTSGVLVGLAAMTKFLPLIFLPYFLLKRNWRAFFAAISVIVPMAMVTEFVLGWRHSGILIQLRQGSYSLGDTNQSLSGMLLRILEWTHASISGALVSRVAILVSLAALAALFMRVRRCGHAEDLEWATLMAAMILLPPHNQNYYLLFLVFAYAVLFSRGRTWMRERPLRFALLLLGFVVTALPLPLSVVNRLLPDFDAFAIYLHYGFGFLGLALTTGLLVTELLAACRVTEELPRHVACT